MKILITGAAGFIGHHVVEHIYKTTDWDIICLDKLTYASNGYNRLRDLGYLDSIRLKTFATDFTNPISPGVAQEVGDVDYVLHLGAETHVDNSITNPQAFVLSNVVGTMHMLELCKTLKNVKKIFYFSTDEVFGPAPEGVAYKEWDRYNSTNPYSASKAGGEQLALAYRNTHKLPITITRTMNCFGERQHPEKFVPMIIKKVLAGESVTIHSNKEKTKAGSRFYIHCRNVASALTFLMDDQRDLGVYHIVGEKEVDNLQMAICIAAYLGKELHYEMVDFHSSRPGHDLRYALDGGLMKSIGWEPPKTFEDSLQKTIQWYVDNPKWLAW